MKRITLCADDYGQNFAISQAIVNLLEKNRLTATSCLTTFPEWPLYSKQLLPYKNRADLGVHFNLTEGVPLSDKFIDKYGPHFPSLPKLMVLAHLRMLDKDIISTELEKQLDCFMDHLDQPPDFIDGHQHVHQFPIIRDVLITLWEKRLKKMGSYIRSTDSAVGGLNKLNNAWVKRFIIQFSGANALKQHLIQLGIPHNTSFEGIYDFVDYSGLFPLFLQRIQNGGLVMCHPGLDVDHADPIAPARYREYSYFMSEQFIEDCDKQGVNLVRFRMMGTNS